MLVLHIFYFKVHALQHAYHLIKSMSLFLFLYTYINKIIFQNLHMLYSGEDSELLYVL